MEGQTSVVLTRRPETLPVHPGQISFPGGRRDDGESLEQTALREAWEEIGLDPDAVRIIGRLTPLHIPPSNYCVYPFVGVVERHIRYTPSPDEVSEIIEVPLHVLSDPGCRRVETRSIRGIRVEVPYFDVFGNCVWGATAMILSELLACLHPGP